jgi:radical SAM superfamily enzyme YgiQ (UPF0313 family)
MPDIVLTTLNARYAHAAFGLRYLHANLGPWRGRAEIVEFDISQRTVDIVEVLLERNPKIVGLGVYIWNVAEATRLVGELKRVRPDIRVVLGGPEVSYETADQEITRLADYVVTGEADLTFPRICSRILEPSATDGALPSCEQPGRIIAGELPQFEFLTLPYDLYTDVDVARRVIYVEASIFRCARRRSMISSLPWNGSSTAECGNSNSSIGRSTSTSRPAAPSWHSFWSATGPGCSCILR